MRIVDVIERNGDYATIVYEFGRGVTGKPMDGRIVFAVRNLHICLLKPNGETTSAQQRHSASTFQKIIKHSWDDRWGRLDSDSSLRIAPFASKCTWCDSPCRVHDEANVRAGVRRVHPVPTTDEPNDICSNVVNWREQHNPWLSPHVSKVGEPDR